MCETKNRARELKTKSLTEIDRKRKSGRERK